MYSVLVMLCYISTVSFLSSACLIAQAKFLWGAENFDAAATEERKYWAGSQDHCGLMFSGINKLHYEGVQRSLHSRPTAVAACPELSCSTLTAELCA